MLFVFSLEISFKIPTGGQVCFHEDLPSGSTLSGRYGIPTDKVQPEIEIIIDAEYNLLMNKTVVKEDAFQIVVINAGVHKICFRCKESAVQSYSQYTEAFLDMNQNTLPVNTQSSDQGVATTILRDAKEITLDQLYAKNRIDQLIRVGKQVRSNVLWIGILAIAASWGVVLLQNALISKEVKRRL